MNNRYTYPAQYGAGFFSTSNETVASYFNAFRKIFVVEDMPAWNPNMRSKTAIRSSDTCCTAASRKIQALL